MRIIQPNAPPTIDASTKINSATFTATTNNIVNIHIPGWPAAWGPPPPAPAAFDPPTFRVTSEMVRDAISSPDMLAKSVAGDPEAIAALCTRILQKIHEAPFERNMYLNPEKSSQALVYQPDEWVSMALADASEKVCTHIVAEGAKVVVGAATAPMREIRDRYMAKKEDIVRKTKPAMRSHLERVHRNLFSAQPIAAEHLPDVRQFGNELHEIAPNTMVTALELALDIISPSDVDETKIREYAIRSISTMARELARDPANHNVVRLDGTTVMVRGRSEWESRPIADAARAQMREFGALVVAFLDADPTTHLGCVADYLRDEKVAAELARTASVPPNILMRYAAVAENRYEMDPHPTAAALRRRMLCHAAAPRAAMCCESTKCIIFTTEFDRSNQPIALAHPAIVKF